jgi:hypothetical protein
MKPFYVPEDHDAPQQKASQPDRSSDDSLDAFRYSLYHEDPEKPGKKMSDEDSLRVRTSRPSRKPRPYDPDEVLNRWVETEKNTFNPPEGGHPQHPVEGKRADEVKVEGRAIPEDREMVFQNITCTLWTKTVTSIYHIGAEVQEITEVYFLGIRIRYTCNTRQKSLKDKTIGIFG